MDKASLLFGDGGLQNLFISHVLLPHWADFLNQFFKFAPHVSQEASCLAFTATSDFQRAFCWTFSLSVLFYQVGTRTFLFFQRFGGFVACYSLKIWTKPLWDPFWLPSFHSFTYISYYFPSIGMMIAAFNTLWKVGGLAWGRTGFPQCCLWKECPRPQLSWAFKYMCLDSLFWLSTPFWASPYSQDWGSRNTRWLCVGWFPRRTTFIEHTESLICICFFELIESAALGAQVLVTVSCFGVSACEFPHNRLCQPQSCSRLFQSIRLALPHMHGC